MAVLAVFLLLALAGARACEEDQRVPSAPVPTTTPATAPVAAVPTQQLPPPPPPPTPQPTPTPSPVADGTLPIVVRRAYLGGRRTAPSLHKFAILNAARLRGRSIVQKLGDCEDGDPDDFYVCPDELWAEALQLYEYSVTDDWCEENPDDRELGRHDDQPLDYIRRIRQSVPKVSVRGSEQEAYDWLRCTEVDGPRRIEANPSTSMAASAPVTELFTNRQVQLIPLPSLSRPASHAPWHALQFQKWNRKSVTKTSVEDMKTTLLSRPPSTTSDIQPEINMCQGYDLTTKVELQDHSYHSVRSQRELEAASLLASMLTPEVTIQMVEDHSEHQPVPVADPDDLPDESMEVDGDDTSDGSFVEVGSVESDAAQAGSHSDNSEETDAASNTPEESMDADIDDMDLEVETGLPDIAVEVQVGTPMKHEDAAAIIQRQEGDVSMEPDNSLQLPVGPPAPQPGPSGLCRPPSPPSPPSGGAWRPPSPPSPPPDEYWRPPSPPPPNISFPDYPGTRYSGHRESAIYSARGYPGSEDVGHLNNLDWVPPPPKDISKELDRVFGVQEDKEESSSQEPEDNRCAGELKYWTSGTNLRPVFMVYVQCRRDPRCQPPLKCAPLVSQVKVSKRKNVPFYRQTFKLLDDPSDEWEPALLNLPTACICAPPDYDPQALRVISLSKSA